MNNITQIEKDMCCGCSACIQSCPVKCITMMEDEEGFSFPKVEKELCMECGKCLGVCPTQNYIAESKFEHVAYAVKCKSDELVALSASGGMFAALATWIIKQKGIVFGASFTQDFSVNHVAAEDLSSLAGLKKSKYLPSTNVNCYKEAYDHLIGGKWVLYTGTPCQIAGLNKYLEGHSFEKLITAQIICHGVPSMSVWRQYVLELEKIYNAKLIRYDFRYKERSKNNIGSGIEQYGWKSPKVKAEFSNGKEFKVFFEKDVFTGGFAKNLYLRNCCYNCKWNYSNQPYNSDFTLGDYYGIEREHPDFDYEMGASAVIINTEKGIGIFDQIKNELDIQRTSIEKIAVRNTPLYTPSKKHSNRELFFEKFISNDYDNIFDLIRNSLGYNFTKINTFGVLGSFNSRWAIWNLLSGSDSELLFHYSNSSFISITSAPANIEVVQYPGNNFRKEMLKADLTKTLFNSVFNANNLLPDFLVIDLLEERFPVYGNGDAFFTKSDALLDSYVVISEQWNLLEQEERYINFINAWEKLLDRLRNIGLPRIILIEMLLCEKYEKPDGKLAEFDNIDEIKKFNQELIRYYSIIKNSIENIIVIELQKKDLWCKKDHRHGVLPCHLNDNAYKMLSDKLFEIIEGANGK